MAIGLAGSGLPYVMPATQGLPAGVRPLAAASEPSRPPPFASLGASEIGPPSVAPPAAPPAPPPPVPDPPPEPAELVDVVLVELEPMLVELGPVLIDVLDVAPPPCPPVVAAVPVEFVVPLSLHAHAIAATGTRMRAAPNLIGPSYHTRDWKIDSNRISIA
jgi:hypothetical protein